MGLRVEIFDTENDELVADMEYESRPEMLEKIAKDAETLVPITDEEIAAMSPEEKAAYLQKVEDELMDELDA